MRREVFMGRLTSINTEDSSISVTATFDNGDSITKRVFMTDNAFCTAQKHLMPEDLICVECQIKKGNKLVCERLTFLSNKPTIRNTQNAKS